METHLSGVTQIIREYFDQSTSQAAVIDPSYHRLWQSLDNLINAGGKRLRPKMTLMAYEAFGGSDTESILPIAAAQELLHFSLLIHDDIIDRDYIRYGTANIAGQYKLTYSPYVPSADNLTHFSHSAAILAGDLMLSGAYHMIASSTLDSQTKITAQHLMATGIFEVAGGELLDTELSFMPYKDGDALKVARYKTASYSFVLPLLTGASLAGASDEQKDAVRSYANALGVAYQLKDDLLGVFGDEEKTGKSTVGDLVEGKRTYLVECALDSLSSADRAIFMLTFGNPHATPLEITTAKQLLESSGARAQTKQKIAEYTDQARRALDQLALSPEHHQAFLGMISAVTDRTS